MAGFDYDLFVIGGGSGGVRAARMAAETGARVGVAEAYRFGGTCVIRGCVPKKLLVYASGFREAFEDAAGYGWDVGAPRFDWARMREAKEREITRLEGVYVRNLENAGCDAHRCRAEVEGPHEVRLPDVDRTVSAKHVLIATGGEPFVPDFPGSEHAVTSDDMFDLPELPERLVIVGGGYIATEFACIMNGLGVKVTQFYRRDLILRGFDDDLRRFAADEMTKKGVDVRHCDDVAAIEKTDGGFVAKLVEGGGIETDLVMYATGRNPSTKGLGLERANVGLSKTGAVVVDAYSQSSVPSIYAVGDVTDRLALTPVAIREGAAFVETVFRGRPTKPDHSDVATAVFTQPEMGTVGLTEAQAREEGEIEVYRSSFKPLLHTLSGRDERALMKLVVRASDRRVLGVHLAGHGAAEMIQLAGVAVKMGATKGDFDRTVAVHPTAAEELVTMRAPVAVGAAKVTVERRHADAT